MAYFNAWNLTDLKTIPHNGRTVMSTFSCGGGSSMGYKLSGFDVVAANDIDTKMRDLYVSNLAPPNYYLCPIKELMDVKLPFSVGELDILDGSPPCTTFSMAGNREDDWGKSRVFREGNSKQVLDDLFFDFIDVANKLQPKVIIAENVKGMLHGNARGYVKAIHNRMREIGYKPQLFLLNSKNMLVPQARERVFFIASRNDLCLPDLKLLFQYPEISVQTALEGIDYRNKAVGTSAKTFQIWNQTKLGDAFSKVNRAVFDSSSLFNSRKINPELPVPTLASTNCNYHWSICRRLIGSEYARLSSFPDDYKATSGQLVYICGMSVPPRMMQCISSEISKQWFKCT